MKTRKQLMLGALALLALYLCGYAYARMTHKIVHMQNQGLGPHQVLARPDTWDDIRMDMAKEKPLLEIVAHGQQKAPGFLDAVFWPLRMIETTYWNRNHE